MLDPLAASDTSDPATTTASRRQVPYHAALDRNALRGARIGVARASFFGYSAVTDRIAEGAITGMKAQGR